MPYRHAYPLLATFLLTGGRRSEVFGLELDDISFDRRTVTFRPNSWRGLKSRSAHRVVPMWPQLEEVLRTYVFAGSGPRGRLLFPSDRGEGERMLTNIDATMREIVERAQIPPEAGHLHALRHTYCAARLQTIDNGVPVAEFTVAREMGHGGHSLVRRIYGHLGTVRHRSGVVEYRIEQHAEKLAARLGALRGA